MCSTYQCSVPTYVQLPTNVQYLPICLVPTYVQYLPMCIVQYLPMCSYLPICSTYSTYVQYLPMCSTLLHMCCTYLYALCSTYLCAVPICVQYLPMVCTYLWLRAVPVGCTYLWLCAVPICVQYHPEHNGRIIIWAEDLILFVAWRWGIRGVNGVFVDFRIWINTVCNFIRNVIKKNYPFQNLYRKYFQIKFFRNPPLPHGTKCGGYSYI